MKEIKWYGVWNENEESQLVHLTEFVRVAREANHGLLVRYGNAECLRPIT